ncbi:MAG: histidinol dehydrogenase [Cognatishimia sp.]|uniref:histidinol dehydrogenase n=1 Tax=Cognatishimia sp. TaxID=2211648 RepID=UPI003B8E6001
MARQYLKKAKGLPPQDKAQTGEIVSEMLREIQSGGEDRVAQYARDLDGWADDIVVSKDALQAAGYRLSEQMKDDIRYAHDNIRNFAEAQRDSISNFETELRPGLLTGQRVIPMQAAGCYVPGGRYSHVASALMSITTAKVAGVTDITACSPPKPGEGVPDSILFAMDLAGADRVLALGGVQGVAAMAQGLFGALPADILVGPGNHFVAEAKRQLFGPVGIDMFAGPTDSLILADETADAEMVAWDLIGQAEHGFNSPVWLATTHAPLAEAVLERIPRLIEELPEPNKSSAKEAWSALGEVMLCDTREEVAQVADDYAPEHLHVQAADLDWWLGRLKAYGSLFLGQETTVPFGDKASGPNHVLPTSRAARYTGGLSVHKFLKTVTWQRVSTEALPDLARVSASISRLEGMEGHARSAEIRLEKLF